jgi:lipopolysaccharide assembly protein A
MIFAVVFALVCYLGILVGIILGDYLVMRAINFSIIFAFCLALALFSLENTDPVVIRIVEGVEIQAPLSIALILTLGAGGTLAWIFGIWTRLLRQLEYRKQMSQMQAKDERIEELEKDLDQYKSEVESLALAASTAAIVKEESV